MAKRLDDRNHDLQLADRVKRLAIAALVSQDDLFDILVLKGGNAIEHAGVPPVRRSIDIDFSVDGVLTDQDGLETLRSRIESLLKETFKEEGLYVFDVVLKKQPPNLRTDVLGEFWGGHKLTFKAIESESAGGLSLDQLRRRSLPLGRAERREFVVDFSEHEFCGDKRVREIDGFNVYVYSERMIICEKVRAICQQMPAYREIVLSGSARPRARDFFDIHHIMSNIPIDQTSGEFWETLTQVFDAKRVPLSLIGSIGDHREFHRENFGSVRDTVSSDIKLRGFDFYVDYLVDLLAPLQSRWEEQPPPG